VQDTLESNTDVRIFAMLLENSATLSSKKGQQEKKNTNNMK
jgi:hypothetical protein